MKLIHHGAHQGVTRSCHELQYADQTGLIDFVASMDQPPKKIRLVHGDFRPKRILRDKLTAMGYDVD